MSKINEQCKREADRRLKPPAGFWSWCYSQITTYKWSNKDKTIIASDLNLGHCIEKRLTKSSRLTFYDKTYFFSIILSTSKRIEIQSYEFRSNLVEGKQFIDWHFTNLERFENDKHVKIGQDYNGQFYPYLFANFFSGGYYTGNKFYPNKWVEKLKKVSELKYLKFGNICYWEIERLYKYKFEIEFAQKIHAYKLANEIMYPGYTGFTKNVDMRTLNRRWLQRNKQFFKNSNRSFNEFELSRRLKERNGRLVPGIESYLTYHDIKHIPKGVGINKFQNWVIKNRIEFNEYLDYLKMLREMGLSLKVMLCLFQRILRPCIITRSDYIINSLKKNANWKIRRNVSSLKQNSNLEKEWIRPSKDTHFTFLEKWPNLSMRARSYIIA